MARLAALTLALIAVVAGIAGAQSASIRGVVRDSAARPMPNADVIIIPGGKRARTDSTGAFAFGSLESGKYVVRTRRVGYAPTEWTIDLSNSGRAELQLVLGARLGVLDTVFVNGDRPCEAQKYEGFLCRRGSANGGVFIDYTDIDTMPVWYSADLLRDVGGFTVGIRSTRNGPTRIPVSRQCTTILLNGVPSGWASIPEEPYNIIGIEVYKIPKDVPKEYRRYTWGKEHCWLLAYWTADFQRPFAKVRLP